MTLIKNVKLTAFALGAVTLVGCGNAPEKTQSTPSEPAVEQEAVVTLADVIADPRRVDDSARDQFRNPKETLEFFEVGPGKKVAEIWPGWYTQIIAPYLAKNDGTYVAVLYPDGVNERLDTRNAAFKERFSDSSVYGNLEYGQFAKDSGVILPADSVDVLLTFRNVHNWMRGGYYDQAMQEFYAAIKPGGILGVVEHRLPETAVQAPDGASGYVQESYMKDAAKRAGFEFVASSEVNANPKDTADHPFGVWTLPPRSRTPEEGTSEYGDFNAELYKNIGESDRATLKFRKPL